MAKAILYVESRPVSDERLDDYHQWYNETHLPEVVAVPGFVSARRFESADNGGSFVAIHEIDDEDPDAVVAALGEAAGAGRLQMSDAIQMDPPPSMTLMKLIAEHGPST